MNPLQNQITRYHYKYQLFSQTKRHLGNNCNFVTEKKTIFQREAYKSCGNRLLPRKNKNLSLAQEIAIAKIAAKQIQTKKISYTYNFRSDCSQSNSRGFFFATHIAISELLVFYLSLISPKRFKFAINFIYVFDFARLYLQSADK